MPNHDQGGENAVAEGQHDIPRRHFVYWMFDADGEALYVGVTKYPEQRLRQHRRNPWFPRVASKRMAGPFTKTTALALERQQQDELQPVYDVRQSMMRTRARRYPNAPTRYSGPALSGFGEVA